MNKCTETDFREMLPDLLHGTLAADVRALVDAHLASCEECREDLEVLRTVKSAAVFAPVIDVDRVVRQIPPYRTIVPAIERPARIRVVSWLVAASLAIVVVGGGSLVLMQPRSGARPVATYGPPDSGRESPATAIVPSQTVTPNTNTPTIVDAKPPAHSLALAADVDGLSDVSLVQLMDEMARFDALPATEPDDVISVDSSYNLEQD
jgi:hypothetical protein